MYITEFQWAMLRALEDLQKHTFDDIRYKTIIWDGTDEKSTIYIQLVKMGLCKLYNPQEFVIGDYTFSITFKGLWYLHLHKYGIL